MNALKADKSWITYSTGFSLTETGKEVENSNLDEQGKLIILSTITRNHNVLRSVYKETAKEMWAACTRNVQGINFTGR